MRFGRGSAVGAAGLLLRAGGLFEPAGAGGNLALKRSAFTRRGWSALGRAADEAVTFGAEKVMPAHLFLALLDGPAGFACGYLASLGRDDVTPETVREAVAWPTPKASAGQSRKGRGSLKGLSNELVSVLAAAQAGAADAGAPAVGEIHLLRALLDALPPILEKSLKSPPLELSVDDFRSRVDQLADRAPAWDGGAALFPWLPGLLPSDDLTVAAEEGFVSPAVVDPDPAGAEPYDRMARALYRKGDRHVLLTGLRGVGRTTALRELARRSSAGTIPFLSDQRFLWVDAADVPPEEGRACLEGIFSQVASEPDVVLCVDNLGPLLRRPDGGNALFLRSLLKGSPARFVGVLTRWEYADLVASEPEALKAFTRVDLDEPDEDLASAIAARAADCLAHSYGLSIPESVSRRAVALSSSYMLSERLPSKAVKILRHACDELDYQRTQLGDDRRELNEGDVLRVVAELTGIPSETLSGAGDAEDFEAALASAVVGQDDAVRTVANELALIKAGLTEPNKPASVLLFAGTTGVGKTELAKRLAELYSASRRVQVYTMGNFTEPHTVSGIIGVPAGYVGHDQGGRLVNELNADPYAVFLLDEAEKAHPNVWKPFLNLFDEGWIVDQRGVKAHADRAIFILTTNAGDDAIAQMTQSGSSPEAIEAHVKGTLSRVRQERSGQPVFTPQFLARVKKVVVFRPLSEGAMVGIARRAVQRSASLWLRKREKAVDVPEPLIARIGRLAHRLNTEAGGKEGGRIVRKLIADLIESPVQRAATSRPAEYRACRRIVVMADDGDDAVAPAVRVAFEPDAESPSQYGSGAE